MNMRKALLIVVSLAAPCAQAADYKATITALPPSIAESVAVPILGYISTPAGLLQIQGVAGASNTIGPMALHLSSDGLILPPGEAYGWLQNRGGVELVTLPAGKIISLHWTTPDLVSFTSNGSAALLYSSAAASLRVAGGLPARATLADAVALPAGAGNVTSLALSDDFSTMLIAASGGVYSRSGAGAWQFLMPGPASAVAFVPGRRDALVATSDKLYFVKDASSPQILVGSGEGINAPLAVGASLDGRTGVVLNTGGVDVITVDLASGATKPLKLGVAARGMVRGLDSTYIFLPQRGSSPWLLDPANGLLSFAPALSGAAPASPRQPRERR